MLQLILVVIGLIAISFLCSILESVILTMSQPYIQVLIDKKIKAGPMLDKMKKNIDEPISAILTLNTISHTVGAAVSGAIAIQVFGSEWMGVFSAVLTLLILILSEIIPKTVGANYWKKLAPTSAYILKVMIFILKPLIMPINLLSKFISKDNHSATVTKAEVKNYIRLGFFQGSIDSEEYSIIENLFKLKSKTISCVMTPWSVVFKLNNKTTPKRIQDENLDILFSRIPIYDDDNKVTGIVMRREIMNRISNKQTKEEIQSFSMEPCFIQEKTSVYDLFMMMIKKKIHMCIVQDKKNQYKGVVTLEDAIETLLGKEIVDEFDPVEDMRNLA